MPEKRWRRKKKAATPSTSSKQAEQPKPEELTEEKEDEEDKGKLKPNAGNGGQTDLYSWTQILGELEAVIPIPPGTKSKQLDVVIENKRLKVGLKGKPPIVEGEFHKQIKPADCTWHINDGKEVAITILKFNNMEWWSQLLKGEPEINTRKINPETSKMDDLDAETRGVVEKMRFDQIQKERGLPSSDEMKKNEMLQKFMAQHPEMDFSKAKIG